jgi:hypothetical protein
MPPGFTTNFWDWVNARNEGTTDHPWDLWHGWANDGHSVWETARNLLFDELSDSDRQLAREWRQVDRSNHRNTPRQLLPELLTALAFTSFEGNTPMAKQFRPKDVMLHSDQDFREILFQKPPRGVLTFRWDIFDEDGFVYPNNRETLAVFIRRTMWDNKKDTGDYEGWTNITGAALGFIRGDKLDVYPFPINWGEIVDDVRHHLRKMTAAEKAKKQLSFELKSLVDLVGWDAVNGELAKLRS